MTLSRDDVEKVALLARLQLSPEELETMTPQLARILDFIEQLGQLDTEGVEPLAHAIERVNVFADDEPAPSLPRDEVLAAAPKRDEECYRVPAVLGE